MGFPKTVPPPALLSVNDSAGVVVAVATEVVNSGARLPALNDVTVPVPAGKSPACMAEETKSVPFPRRNWPEAAAPEIVNPVVALNTGAVAVPVKVGLANGARLESRVPEFCTFPDPSVLTTSPAGAAAKLAAAVAAVVVFPEPATVTVPVVVIGPPVAIPAVPTDVTVPVPAGKSVATKVRKVGVAGTPAVGPAQTVCAVCVDNAKVREGVVVGVATAVVAIASIFPALKLVTVPAPLPDPVTSGRSSTREITPVVPVTTVAIG